MGTQPSLMSIHPGNANAIVPPYHRCWRDGRRKTVGKSHGILSPYSMLRLRCETRSRLRAHNRHAGQRQSSFRQSSSRSVYLLDACALIHIHVDMRNIFAREPWDISIGPLLRPIRGLTLLSEVCRPDAGADSWRFQTISGALFSFDAAIIP